VSNSQKQNPLYLEWFKAIALPLVIVLVGHWLATATKEKETQAHYVDIAVSILREPAKPDNSEIREWATEVISRYSPIPLPSQAAAQLRDAGLDRVLQSVRKSRQIQQQMEEIRRELAK